MPVVPVSPARELVDSEVPAEVSGASDDTLLDRLAELFRTPSPEASAAYAELGAKPGAVGDDSGVLSRRNADGGIEPV